MPAARRKNSRRLREASPDVRAAIDRARAAQARALSPDLRAKLDESWAEFRRDLGRLKASIAQRRKKLDAEYGLKLHALGIDYDQARRRLEAENDERRERILRNAERVA